VEKHALPIRALLVPQPCGAVLGRTQLRLKNTIAILGAVDCLNAALRILLFLERHINAERLVLAIRASPIANRDLLDVSVLTEKLGLAQGL
jgi:hypothetical protein